MAVAYLILFSCLAYGIVALPPGPSYLSQVGAGSAAYRPTYGSVLGGHNAYNGLAGNSISSVGFGGFGGFGGFPSGYHHTGVSQQLPVHNHPIGVPIGIDYRHHSNGYHQGVVGPVTSGYGQGLPSKYSHGPY